MSLAGRAIRSVLWAGGGGSLAMAIGFVRAVLLARALPIEVFGVYALAAAIVGLGGALAQFGTREALLHRAPETEDEEPAAAAHFTLTLATAAAWLGLVALGAWAFAPGELGTALVAIAAAHAAFQLTLTPRALLARRVAHRRLSLFSVVEAAVAACVAVALARAGFGIWALLAVDAVRALMALCVFYAWRPVWRPRLLWSHSRVRYFLRFGRRNVVGQLLDAALRRLDKLWLGMATDPVALGLYSRAVRFARVPGSLVGEPLVAVSGGAFAELEGDRPRGSRAFFQTAALAVRGSFLVAGTLALVAPQFVSILLGERWLPMLTSFRILLAAFPLALVTQTLVQLFLARGRPETVVRVRGTQVAVLAAGLAVLTPGLGRDGAALAVAAATLVGLALSLRFAREHVDFSARRLFGVPLLALAVALPLAAWSAGMLPPDMSDWSVGAVGAMICASLYVAVLWAFERRELTRAIATVLRESPR